MAVANNTKKKKKKKKKTKKKKKKKINAIKHNIFKTIVRDESQCHSIVPFFVLSGVGEFKWRFLKQRIRDFYYKLN